MTYDGIHQVDLARWLCGVKYPKTVYSSGNRYERDGAAESPDMQSATLDFDGVDHSRRSFKQVRQSR
jgi:predicted dehydrogenase